jgi:hypothetical protein
LKSSEEAGPEPSYVELTMTEFLIGQEGSTFKGIYPLIKKFMEI